MARSQVTREFKVCAGCGAKNRPDWRACQRCRRALHAAAAPPARRERPWGTALLGAGVLLPALVVVVTMAWPEAPVQTAKAAQRAPVEAAFEVPAPVQVSSSPAEAVQTPVTKDDFARAGAAAYAQGNLAVALSAFEAAAAQFPDDPDARNNLGQILVRMGRGAEAVPHLEAAANGDPERWTYRFNLARARSQNGDWAGAVADYQLASQLFPDDHVTLYNLGRAQQKLGEHAAAAQSIERAIELEPSDPSFLLTLAFSYEKLSRLPQALQAYKDYLAKDPRSRQAETIRARIGQLEQVGSAGGRVEATALVPSGA
jgi:tetratricopeptide (TPR) repeat protein